MKTKISLIIAVLLAAVGIAQTFTIDGLNYEVTSTNEVQITGGTPGSSDLVIPSTVSFENQFFTVVKVGESAFEVVGLTSVTFPNTIRDIDNFAFRNNQLTSLSLPNGLTRIGFRAFQSNTIASELIIPNSVNDIGNASFENNQINSIVISENITNLGNFTFAINNLVSVTIPTNVTRIGINTFRDNPLTEIITLGNTPPSIFTGGTDDTFFGNRANIDLTVPTGSEAAYEAAGWTGFRSVNGNFEIGDTFVDNNLNYTITSLTPNQVEITGGTPATSVLVIPETVTIGDITFTIISVGIDAFRQKGLTSVNFPTTIRTIGERAFQQNQLTNLVLPEGLIDLGLRAFQGSNIVNLTLPDGLITIDEAAFSGNRITNLDIPASVTSIEAVAFRNNPLTSLTLSEGLVNIGDEAFRINQLTSLTLPSTVTSVGARAFETNNLTAVNSSATTPPTITTGTNDSFGNRSAIDLTIPPGSEAAYEAAIWTGFRSVNGIEVGDTFIDNNLNYTVTSVIPYEVELIGGTTTDVVIPETVSFENQSFTVVSVGESAFEAAGLTNVTFPNTIKVINTRAFQNNQLTRILLPNSLTSIGFRAFQSNTIAGALVIPNSVISIGNASFENNQISSIVISENLTNLGNNTFRLNNLTNVTIPANITTIGNSTFKDNPLTEVTSSGTNPPSIFTGGSNDSFFGLRGNIDLTIPVGTTQAYLDAGWTGFKSIAESTFDVIAVSLKVFLQGAAVNSNTGEENLLRDDLRVAGVLPTTSPYIDGLTTESVVLETVGADAIVDWVFIQLRDATDQSIVVAEQSALLQRDGDVVGVDGFSLLRFTQDAGDYFIAVEHRNHLGILSANAIALSNAPTVIDFTTDLSTTQGGINALVAIRDGVFGMVAGDLDENGQVQPSDVSQTTALIGTASYSNADMDMNGQIQPADVNTLINPNVGRGVQLLARSTFFTTKSKGAQEQIKFIYAPKVQAPNKQAATGR